MAETNTATENGEDAKPKKSKKKLIIILLALLLIGGGVGGFFYIRKTSANNTADTNKNTKAEEESAEESEGGEEDVKQVVELQPFIVNLADADETRYLRLTLSVGVGEIGEKPSEVFITRVRNAILAVLTTKKSEEVLTIEGKAELRKEILEAAQEASEEPKVLAVYITDFIVQM